MDYLLCIPARETNTRENCEKIHNVLARMSDTYKLRIVPEPVKNKQFPCPPYYKKYRIYKPVKERDTNGEAYLEKEEEEMILSSCKTEEEQELMKGCIYAYQYSAAIVLKSFREKEKKNKMQVRPLSERTQAAKGAGTPVRGGRPGTSEKVEKPESERGAQERPSGSDRPERSDRAYRNRTADRAAEGGAERAQGRERDRSERERASRVSGAERTADRRGGNRAVPESEKKEERPLSGRRERFERRSARRGERPEVERNEVVREKTQEIEVQAQQRTEVSGSEIVKAEPKKVEVPEPSKTESTNPGVQRPESPVPEMRNPEIQSVKTPTSEPQKPESPKTEPQNQAPQIPTSQAPASRKTEEEELKATPLARSNDISAQGALPFRAHAETGSLPPFRDTTATVTAQPMQRKSEGYAPMERKPAAQPQEPDPQA